MLSRPEYNLILYSTKSSRVKINTHRSLIKIISKWGLFVFCGGKVSKNSVLPPKLSRLERYLIL